MCHSYYLSLGNNKVKNNPFKTRLSAIFSNLLPIKKRSYRLKQKQKSVSSAFENPCHPRSILAWKGMKRMQATQINADAKANANKNRTVQNQQLPGYISNVQTTA
jgi:hypothetical protein